MTWLWVGAVTSDSARAVAKIEGSTGVLTLSTAPDLSDATDHPDSPDGAGVVSFDLADLTPSTTYHYALDVDGAVEIEGTFATFPPEGEPANITIVHGSCQNYQTQGDAVLWERVLDRTPDLVLHLGDLGYANIAENDESLYLAAYDDQLRGDHFTAALQSLPFAYVFDDHDYGPNSSNKDSPGRPAALAAYRRCVPHYPLHTADGAVYQAFSIGRVRVIVTDGHSNRDPNNSPDGPTKTMLGAEQKAWLQSEMLAAKAAGQMVLWGSGNSWRAISNGGWRYFPDERDELGEWIAANEIPVAILSGDIHAVGIDDGTHTAGGIPEFTAAPFAQAATSVGEGPVAGEYSHGGLMTGGAVYPDGIMQYGVTTIADSGDGSATVTWEAYHVESDGSESLLTSYTFQLGAAMQPAIVHVWDGTSWVAARTYSGDTLTPSRVKVQTLT